MEELLRTGTADTISIDPRDAEIGAMLLAVARSLVDKANELELLSLADAEGVAFQIRSAAEDVGKLIGKSGRTARAIRTILNGNSVKNGRRYSVDFGKKSA